MRLDRIATHVFRSTDYFAERVVLRDLERVGGEATRVSRQSYRVAAPASVVFSAYTQSGPSVLFPRTHLQFRRAYLPGASEPILEGDAWPGLVEGMKIFADLVLRPLRWGVMVPVVVSQVDASRRVLQYDYLEGAITRGYNRVTLTPSGDATVVDHLCRFDGTSLLANATFPLLYDRFHVGFVDRMHASVGAHAEALHRAM